MRFPLVALRFLLLTWLGGGLAIAAPATPSEADNTATVLKKDGQVETLEAPGAAWQTARTNEPLRAGTVVRTGERSRALLRLLDQSHLQLGELSQLLIKPPASEGKPGTYSLLKGLFYLFHRNKPEEALFDSPIANAGVKGTEFLFAVEASGRTVLTLFDGEAELSNALGTLRLKSGEQGVVDPGQPPVKTPALFTTRLIQWCLYYPGVLDPDDLELTPAEAAVLAPALAAYRAGDLQAALAAYPPGRQLVSDFEKVFLGALLLAVGRVDQSEALLDTLAAPAGTKPARLASALRDLIATVLNLPPAAGTNALPHKSATEHLAASYVHQARADLAGALRAARASTAASPRFGFAWTRVAELEFSFGRTRDALAALDESLRLAPRNAQAVALHGFLLSAQNCIPAAQAEFDRAIALDGALGNAWLGRGLCKIRRGDSAGGRADLQAAAALEPQRALLRSYLGKAWQLLDQTPLARRELQLARQLDPLDPTAALYSALLLQQGNRINEAILELERSQSLNDHRAIYRSRLLLDQDRAVRGANLANIYRDAGMTDWSVREAGKAVNADYANYSAHLFLANSYNDLRDPRSVNLRYETPWLSEYLLANLLAPVGAGTLSQTVSQQEYSRLFERDRLGLVSTTEYLERGAWSQSVAQYGTYGSSSYVLEGSYLTDPGEHINGQVEQWGLSLQLKQQLGPADNLYFQATTAETKGGDLNQRFDPDQANALLRFQDEQEPLLLAGYHHEWAPDSHTLLLFSRLSGRLRVVDPDATSLNTRQINGREIQIIPQPYDQHYDSTLEIYGWEAQQILELRPHTLVFGGLVQGGEFETSNQHVPLGQRAGSFWTGQDYANATQRNIETSFLRLTAYAYETWQALPSLRLIAGVAYDYVEFPRNHRFAPVKDGTDSQDGLLPKAGFIWNITERSSARFGYTRSLSGASFDQSFRLEPTQVAGFNQAFRSVIPETLVGAHAGAEFDTFDVAWEHRFPTHTYAGVTLELLRSSVDRWRGAYLKTGGDQPVPNHLAERLDYEEKSLLASLDQLLGDQWVAGAAYRWSQASLRNTWPTALPIIGTGFEDLGGEIRSPNTTQRTGDLHQLQLRLLYHHPSGFFAGTEGVWRGQEASQDDAALPSSWFWQWNLHLGWRSPQRRFECGVGLLNVLGEWQGLHPINLHTAPPRLRTLATQVRLAF